MSQQRSCPFCRRIIRLKDKYCPFCGRYVLETPPQNVYPRATPPGQQPSIPRQSSYPAQVPAQIPPSTQPQVPHPASPQMPPQSPRGIPLSPFSNQVPQPPELQLELSEEIIEQIALRVELRQLDSALADIRAKLEELGEMIAKMDVTAEIEQKIKVFKDKIKALKAKRERLNAEKRVLPFEKDLKERKEIQERLNNLNEAYRSKEVTESAFKKLRQEYEEKLQEIDTKSRAFKAKINLWIKKIKTDEIKIKEEEEILKARHAAGELIEDEYQTKKSKIDEKLKQYTNVIKYLSEKL
ncbi:MAG: hypothetical protein ACTSRC_01630 [Candidatus Helarchaeota archaeon]